MRVAIARDLVVVQAARVDALQLALLELQKQVVVEVFRGWEDLVDRDLEHVICRSN